MRLFESASEELAGPIDYRQSYVDFGNLVVRDAVDRHAAIRRTGPAAYGYSFAAGSTEDGGGQPLLFKRRHDQARPVDRNHRQAGRADRRRRATRVRKAHPPKPILFAPGATDPPLLPNVLPVGVARIGQLALWPSGRPNTRR